MKLHQLFEEIIKTNRGHIEDHGNYITKVTEDPIEYENALRLIKTPNKNFVKYFSAKPIGNSMFELTMEKVNELSDAEWYAVDLVLNTLGRQDYMLDGRRRALFINELRGNPEWYDDYGSLQKMVRLINNMYDMYAYAQRNGFQLFDLRPQNMGRTNDGRLVHFDVGSG